MFIKEITDKNQWEKFLEECREKTFLQSWNWGEFNRKTGNKIWRLGIFEAGGEPFSAALVVKVRARRGTFLFVPHGPLLRRENSKSAGCEADSPECCIRTPNQIPNPKFQVLNTILEKLKEIAKKENVSFIRIASVWERTEDNNEIFKKLGFKEAPIHIHPELTWELDISKPEEELLRQMRKTTRYLIRQGLKNKDIKVEQSNNPKEDLEKFSRIYQETARRHHFTPFSFAYLKNELESFLPDNQISLFLGKYKNEIISGAMVIFWQGTAFYHQGASLPKYSKISTSYLLQWEAIKEAKKRGCQVYNFWGIAPLFATAKSGNSKFQVPNSKQIPISKHQTPNKKHPWYGLTLFKMGFGGRKKEYVKTQDLPLASKYWLTYFVERIRKIKRGL